MNRMEIHLSLVYLLMITGKISGEGDVRSVTIWWQRFWRRLQHLFVCLFVGWFILFFVCLFVCLFCFCFVFSTLINIHTLLFA